ncbi:KTSC domain-containing protein [Parapedobacter luteus]|uniref:KTSC domain-containing protein n=1 Tax=Parapedobacter luteus TaxID=623280 RepID=A0A1T5DDE4_9SPHI|nr:KTSC domain-containing protein [Parapedobacter luteus]SKB69533.1 KTSC domain-containing protein [Parapedobacter luteus]
MSNLTGNTRICFITNNQTITGTPGYYVRRLAMPSSVIRHIDYSETSNILKITFQTGAVYTYYEVPEMVYIGLRKARSKGKYFNAHIAGQYAFDKISS